jgi:hypothetical protein
MATTTAVTQVASDGADRGADERRENRVANADEALREKVVPEDVRSPTPSGRLRNRVNARRHGPARRAVSTTSIAVSPAASI